MRLRLEMEIQIILRLATVPRSVTLMKRVALKHEASVIGFAIKDHIQHVFTPANGAGASKRPS